MKYLVTGGAGFIGSECVRQLMVDDNNKVYVVDKLTYAADLKRLPLTNSNLEIIELDIINFKNLTSLVQEIDVVLHFAAETHVDNSITNGYPFVKTNIEGSYEILETCRASNSRLIMVSTDEVYGPFNTGEAHENDNLKPSSVYSASKAGADLLSLANIKTHNQNLVITRCCNNYGPNQNPEKFLPTVIESIRQNKKIPLYGDGKNIREWIHVKDHVRAILKLIQHWTPGEIFNIGTKDRFTNIEIVRKILSICERTEDLIDFVPDRKGHDLRYALNSEKIKNHISWIPEISIEDGLRELLEASIVV